MTKHVIIYIPGLGDHHLRGQRAAVALWRRFGVRPEICQMNWIDKQPFEPKLQKILDTIDTHIAQGHTVSLAAVSAGANIALHAFARRADNVAKLILVCGAIQDPSAVGEDVKRNNPAFWQSMLALHDGVLASLTTQQRKKITTFIPQYDDVVNVKNMRIDGANIAALPTKGHVKSIAYAITVGAKRIVYN